MFVRDGKRIPKKINDGNGVKDGNFLLSNENW